MDHYRKWVCRRILGKVGGNCPVCQGEDATALHILGEHAVPALPPPPPASALWYLRTDLEPAVVRCNIRLVGELLEGRCELKWLKNARPDSSDPHRGGGEGPRAPEAVEE